MTRPGGFLPVTLWMRRPNIVSALLRGLGSRSARCRRGRRETLGGFPRLDALHRGRDVAGRHVLRERGAVARGVLLDVAGAALAGESQPGIGLDVVLDGAVAREDDAADTIERRRLAGIGRALEPI